MFVVVIKYTVMRHCMWHVLFMKLWTESKDSQLSLIGSKFVTLFR